LRRGISVLKGGAFERLFCSEGREFEQAKSSKVQMPRGLPRGGDFEASISLIHKANRTAA